MPNLNGHSSGSGPTPHRRAFASIRAHVRPAAKLALALGALAMLAGCAAPAPPVTPTENIPTAVSDLTARQVGNSVVLHFTLPQRAIDGSSLAGGRRVEIFRRFSSQPPSSSSATPAQAPSASAAPAFTIGSAALAADLSGNTVSFTDALGPQGIAPHLGQTVTYFVKTAAGRSRWSKASNAAELTLARVSTPAQNLTATPTPNSVRPNPPQGLEAIAVGNASGSLEVDLSWAISGAGDLAGYNVYRSRQPSGHGVRLNRQLLASPAFRDMTVAPGVGYRYWVIAVNAAGEQSAPSAPVTVSVPAGAVNAH